MHTYTCPGCGTERIIRYAQHFCESVYCTNPQCEFHWKQQTIISGGSRPNLKVVFDTAECNRCRDRLSCLTKAIVQVQTKRTLSDYIKQKREDPIHSAPGRGRLHNVLLHVLQNPGVLYERLSTRGKELAIALMLGLLRAELPEFRGSKQLIRFYITDYGLVALSNLSRVQIRKRAKFPVHVNDFWVDFFRISSWASY